MSPHVQFSLKIRILHAGVFRWTDPNGGQNGGQTHSQLCNRLTLLQATPARPATPANTAKAKIIDEMLKVNDPELRIEKLHQHICEILRQEVKRPVVQTLQGVADLVALYLEALEGVHKT
jgi:hypothetical protein